MFKVMFSIIFGIALLALFIFYLSIPLFNKFGKGVNKRVNEIKKQYEEGEDKNE